MTLSAATRNDESGTTTGSAGRVSQWEHSSLADLVEHIQSEHHAYARLALRRLLKLSFQAREAGELIHPELASVQRTIAELAGDLVGHMLREEETLFPFVRRLETVVEGRREGRLDTPAEHFGATLGHLEHMDSDHDHEGRLLSRLRTLTAGFEIPSNATTTHAALVTLLREFAERFTLHVELETLLLSRVAEMERRANES